jgi:hypothetical protein
MPAAHKMRIGPRWLVIGGLLTLFAFLSLSGIRSWPDQSRGMRYSNKSEEFFRYMAQQLNEPVLCEKIPWAVKIAGGFFISESYERSDCYDFIARRTANPWLCWRVKRLGAFRLLDEQTSLWSCLDHAFGHWNGGMAISDMDLVRFFEQMGYDPDTIQLEGITPPVVFVKDVYVQLPNRPDIAARIEHASSAIDTALTGSSTEITNASYMADMAAMATKDPGWCLRIPENLALAGARQKLRNWCLFKLGINNKNPELCRLIPASADSPDPRMSFQAECSFEVKAHKSDNIRYGVEVPVDDERMRAMITFLGYEIPRAKDLPLDRIYAAYDHFLDELSNGTDARHNAARQRFIARVQSLADTN